MGVHMDIVLPVSTKLLITTYNHHAFAMSILQYNLSNVSEHEKKTAGDFAAWYCAEKEYIYQFILLLEK